MVRFIGQFRYTIDHKGRINIPAKFRNAISQEGQNTVVVTRGLEKCLYVYPLNVWNTLMENFEDLPLSLKNRSLFNRRWGLPATHASFDKQGRIPIPPDLYQYAQIEKEVVIGGAIDRIEIWNPQLLEEYMTESEGAFAEILEKVILSANKSSQFSSARSEREGS